MSRSRHRGGFTLLEILVAFAILAVSTAVLYQIFGQSLDRSADARAEALAATVAGSVLDRMGADLPLRDGNQDGSSDEGYRWHVTITPYGSDQDHAAWPADAHIVTIWVRSPDGRPRYRLDTLKLSPKSGAS